MSKYSIVIPVYNSEKSLRELYVRIKSVFENVIKEDYELIFVDDFSKDDSFNIIYQMSKQDNRIVAIQLARNCGQHAALLCGFNYVHGDYIITMDDDLQHPPEQIPRLIEGIQSDDNYDVIIGRYDTKKHNILRNWGTKVSSYISYKMYGKPKQLELTSFRLIKRFVVEELCSMSVSTPRIGNMIIQINGRVGNVLVEHDERKYGKSGYSFGRLVKDLINNVITNSSFPLQCVKYIGGGSIILSFLLGGYYFIKYLVIGTSVVGWTSLFLAVLMLGGLILCSIGIVGDYLLRILNESKKVPQFFVRKVISEGMEK